MQAALDAQGALHIPARAKPYYLDCTVRNLSISGVRVLDSQADLPIDQVVRIIEQKLNPDYPKTTPRGGGGKGIWIR